MQKLIDLAREHADDIHSSALYAVYALAAVVLVLSLNA